MTSILKIVGVAMVVGVLCVGVVALATDFVWDANTTNTDWEIETNWDLDSGFPSAPDDNAAIDEGGNLCTYSGPGVVINRVTLAGASPTKRKLHVKTGGLFPDELLLQDYGELDADVDMTVLKHTEFSGNVWIDVASGITVTLVEILGDHGAVHVESAQTVLTLTTPGTAKFNVAGILIDADAANAARALKVRGGDLDLTTDTGITILSDSTAGNRAKFWLASSASIRANGPAIDCTFVTMKGGNAISKRAELDLDNDLQLSTDVGEEGIINIEGYASIDIAANKTLAAPTLVIGSDTIASSVRLVAATGAKVDVN